MPESQQSATLEALQHTSSCLHQIGLTLGHLAHVVQYNKMDAEDALPVERLRDLYNPHGALGFEATAVDGLGVWDTHQALISQIVEGLTLPLAASA